MNIETATLLISIIAVIIALIALYYERMDHNRNKNNDKKMQADKISAHMIDSSNVRIENNSDVSIYDVFVIVCSNKQDLTKLNTWYKNYIYLDSFPPGKEERIIETPGDACGHEKATANIFFTDGNGLQWCRNNKGKLSVANGYKEKLKIKIKNKKICPPFY